MNGIPDDGRAIEWVRRLTGGVLILKFLGPRRGVFHVEAMLDGWTFPYIEGLPVPSAWMLARIEEAMLLFGILLAAGVFARVVAPLAAALLTYVFFTSQWNYLNGLWLTILTLWVLAALPEKRRCLQTLVCVVFGSAFLWKLNGAWFSGRAIASMADAFVVPVWKLPGWMLTWPVLILEGGFPIAVWFPRARVAALVAAVVFCVAVECVTPTDTFVFQVMALLASFKSRAQSALSGIQSAPESPPPAAPPAPAR